MTAVATPPAAAQGTAPAAAGDPPAVTPPATPPAVPPVTPPVAVQPVVPESYTLVLPKDSLLEPKVADRLTPLLKELKVMDNAVGQKVLDAVHAEASEVARVYEAARAPGGTIYATMQAGFAKDALADPFLGNGDEAAFAALTAKAGEFLAHYGPELAERQKVNGEGINPAFLRFIKRISLDGFGEKGQAKGGPQGTVETPLSHRFAGDVDKHLAAAGIITK